MSDTDPKDPLIRSLVTLGLIPRHPRSISTQEMHAALKNRGFDISLRTLQRDLTDKLSLRFPLIRNDDERGVRWSFDSNAQINLPATDPAAALAMSLAEDHLKHILPPGVLACLEPQFAEARRQLEALDSNPLANWAKRVRAVPNGKALLPATVDSEVWSTVATALLERRLLKVEYLSRAKNEMKHFILDPKGLASRGHTSYLIATADEYTDMRHYALHRIQTAEVLQQSADLKHFDIDTYLPEAAFTRRQGAGTAELVADVDPELAWILRETPITERQSLQLAPDTGWYRLQANVPLDEETFMWLRSLGPQCVVHSPIPWREAITNELKKMSHRYNVSQAT